jgi:hypothetical protein
MLKKLIHWKKNYSREQCKWIALFMWTVTVKKSNTGKKNCSREQCKWIAMFTWTVTVKKINTEKKVHVNSASELHCSCEQCIHSWTQCVSQVVTRQKAVFYCFQQIVVLPHINGGTMCFDCLIFCNQTVISCVFKETQTPTRCQTGS